MLNNAIHYILYFTPPYSEYFRYSVKKVFVHSVVNQKYFLYKIYTVKYTVKHLTSRLTPTNYHFISSQTVISQYLAQNHFRSDGSGRTFTALA